MKCSNAKGKKFVCSIATFDVGSGPAGGNGKGRDWENEAAGAEEGRKSPLPPKFSPDCTRAAGFGASEKKKKKNRGVGEGQSFTQTKNK